VNLPPQRNPAYLSGPAAVCYARLNALLLTHFQELARSRGVSMAVLLAVLMENALVQEKRTGSPADGAGVAGAEAYRADPVSCASGVARRRAKTAGRSDT
jgi:hypothetical protein